MWRIGWTLHSYKCLSDDRGRSFDLSVDPPAVIVQAAQASVRRWRLARVARSFTALHEFCHQRRNDQGQVTWLLDHDVMDISGSLRRVLSGKAPACKRATNWSSKHAPMLRSALTGGQWPQARIAAMRTYEHGPANDDRCQLCLQCPGTLEHRYNCSVTRPVDGWIASDRDSEQLLAGLSSLQRLCLRTRGIMLCRMPPPPPSDASFHGCGNLSICSLTFASTSMDPRRILL